MSTQNQTPDPGVNGSIKTKLLEVYARLVKENESIFIQRQDLLEALDEDEEELNEAIDNTFSIFREDEYSDYDVLYLKPELYSHHKESFEDLMKKLSKAYEMAEDNFDELLKSMSNIVTLYYLSQNCLEGGEPLAFFLYKGLVEQGVEFEDSEEKTECSQGDYTCEYTRRFGSVEFVKEVTYINYCLNSHVSVGIQKGFIITFKE